MQEENPTNYTVNESILTFLKISNVDREEGHLTLRGYDIGELSGKAEFEEAAYLLWHGKLPNQSQYYELSDFLSLERGLQPQVVEALRIASRYATGMDMLRIGAAALSIGCNYDYSRDLDLVERQVLRLQAQMPVIVAYSSRFARGLDVIEPKPEHGLAEGFLYMLDGIVPDKARIAALNAFLVAVAEHGLNASTFALRVVIGTNSDMVSALTAAIGALKGPRHGGAPGPAHAMLQAIGKPENAEAYIRAEVEAGRIIPGFGHRIYKVRDPRAIVLAAAAERLADATGDRHLINLASELEKVVPQVLNEYLPGGYYFANVALYSAIILSAIGIPPEIFTDVFAIGRTAGWTAHIIDQLEEDRLIRPSSRYVGERGLTLVPIEQRK